VLSWNEGSGHVEYQRVAQTFVRQAEALVVVTIEGEEGAPLVTTQEHPFYVHRARDSLGDDEDEAGEWVAAGELRAGDRVRRPSGEWVRVLKIETRAESAPVYNFEVAKNHTYFVGKLGVLVHNACNLTPPGAGRRGAFNQAKRDAGVPTSQQPSATRPNTDRWGNPTPGRQYDFDVPAPGGGTRRVTIRDDAGGHDFGHNNPQNMGPHFNGPRKTHYEY
jgi:pretoxin HINT domain-containing protein/HNH/endonuclease VII toxin of polymorphic toxin system component